MNETNRTDEHTKLSVPARRAALVCMARTGAGLATGTAMMRAGVAGAQSTSAAGQPSSGPLNTIRTGPRGGPPVVFLHPLGLDLTYWSDQIDALSGEHDVIAFDLPGNGSSPGVPADYSLEAATAHVARVITEAGAGPAHVVGISVGGMLAQSLAIRHPDTVRSLALVATAATFPDAAREAMRARADAVRADGMSVVVRPSIERWFTPETVERRPQLMDRITKTLLGDDPAVHAAMWEMVADFEVVDDIAGIEVPTLVLVGADDPSTPVASSELLHARIPDSRLEIVADASHMVMLEQPETVSGHLRDFIAANA